MRALVLGAGLQGSACAYDLLRSDGVERVILADRDVARAPRFLEPYRDDPRLERVHLDARDEEAVRQVMARADACMNALPYYFNLEMATLAVRVGIHYADLGGNTGIVFQQLQLDEVGRARGISAVPDCGLAPGMVNILAAAAIRELDRTDTVRIRVGGLPQQPLPPLNYQIVYSLEGVLDYYTNASWVLREGEPRQVEALSEVEPVEFPQPVGTLEAFHTAGGLSTLPWTYQGRVRTMDYKTLRYPGHAAIMRAVRDLGLLAEEPVLVHGEEVVPRQVFLACAEPRLRRPEGRDLVALRVEVTGSAAGAESRRIVYDLLDYYDEATGISAMERTTGFSLSITGQMQAARHVNRTGVSTPDQCIPVDEYIRELDSRGVRIRRREG